MQAELQARRSGFVSRGKSTGSPTLRRELCRPDTGRADAPYFSAGILFAAALFHLGFMSLESFTQVGSKYTDVFQGEGPMIIFLLR